MSSNTILKVANTTFGEALRIAKKTTARTERTEPQVRQELQTTMKTLAQDYPVYVHIRSRVASVLGDTSKLDGNIADVNKKFLKKIAAEKQYYRAIDDAIPQTNEPPSSPHFRDTKVIKKYEDKYTAAPDYYTFAPEAKSLSASRRNFVAANSEYQKSRSNLSPGEKQVVDRFSKKIDLLVNVYHDVIDGKMVGLADHIKNLQTKIHELRQELSRLQNK